MSMGLILCSVGDFCIEMETHPKVGNELWFIFGLVSFLIGHVYFLRGMHARVKEITVKAISSDNQFALPFVSLIFIITQYLILPSIDDPVLAVGVVVYGVVMSALVYWSIILNTCNSNLNAYFNSTF